MTDTTSIQQGQRPLSHLGLVVGVIIGLLASLLVGLPVTRTSLEILEKDNQQLHATLSKQVSVQAAEAIFSQDLLSLNVILSGLIEDPRIQYGAVYNLSNKVIAEQGKAESEQTIPVSIRYQDQVIGLLEIRLDPAPAQAAHSQLYGLWIVLNCLFSAISALIGWAIGRFLGHHLERLAQSMEQWPAIGQGALSEKGLGELSRLEQSIEQSASGQRAQRAMISAINQFMTPSMEEDLSFRFCKPQLPEHYTHGAVLFIDILDLADVQEDVSPMGLAHMLNQYYTLIHQAAKLYNGSVDKYMGDGVMVLFGVPQPNEKDVFHGVCTALLLIGLLDTYNRQRKEQGLPILQFQLGLHSGRLLAGTFGDQDNLSYTAVGDVIHHAARLCRKSQPSKLLVSQKAIEDGAIIGQISVEDGPELNGDPALKSKWVLSLIPTYQALIERQTQHICAQHIHPNALTS